MIGTVLGLVIIGIVAGYLARLIVPGRDDMSVAQTIVLGIVGSFVGGFLGFLLFHKDGSDGFVQPSSWIGSIVGAVIALLVYNAVSGRKGHHRSRALS